MGFPGGASGEEPACQCRRHKRHGLDPWVRKIPLEEGVATYSSILAWRIPRTEEPGRLQCMSPKESDMTGQLSNSNKIHLFIHSKYTIIVYRVYQKYKRSVTF